MSTDAAITVVRPQSLDAALGELAAGPSPARLLAGGTDMLVELHAGKAPPSRVVDLSRVAELKVVHRDSAGLRLGALTTLSTLLANADVAAAAPLLAEVARQFAAPQIRNRATIGGNLATASPAGDLAPALLALDTRVRLCSRRGVRELPLREFCLGYRRHAATTDELVESVFVPARPPGERAAFAKVGPRQAQAIAKVSLALALVVRDGAITALRAAAGAVADRPVSLPSLAALVGQRPTSAAIVAAATSAAQHDIAPIDDVRSSARYRRHVVQRLCIELVTALLREASA